MALVLHGFRYSVYVRVARIALAEKKRSPVSMSRSIRSHRICQPNLDLHPFRRVPTLVDEDFVL
jgi:glutathione S-transferase